MRTVLLNLCLLIAMVLTACNPAAEAPELVAPNIFIRGVQLPNGVRYTATFIKPADTTELREVLVEITIPATVNLMGMSVPRQVSSAEVRDNGATRTLIWRIAQVEPEAAVDALVFNVSEPLTDGLEFFMSWRDVDGREQIEHFTDFPPVQAAGQAEAQLTITQAGYLPVGESGVQVSAPVREPALQLGVKVLPAAFNPPAEYGAFWWCSLVEVEGVPAGETVDVIVPLRRPVAPFTALALFRQNADGSWSSAPGQGVVTADGLFVAYAHPGGVLATGGDQSLQPAQVDFATISDGASNTLAISEAVEKPASENPPAAPASDGSSNTIIISEATPAPPERPAATQAVTDGTSNTIIISEATAAAPLKVTATSQGTDGASNTIIISEATTAPPERPAATQAVTDGASNTIIISDATAAAPLKVTATAQGTDGASNTIIISEATAATPLTVTPTPTSQGTDGTSNTIIISEATAAAPLKVTATSQGTDGASNTIIISEATRTPVTVRIITATPTSRATVEPTLTRVPLPVITLGPVIAINPNPATVTPAPLGNNSVRVFIMVSAKNVIQCQAGGVLCSTLRRIGKR